MKASADVEAFDASEDAGAEEKGEDGGDEFMKKCSLRPLQGFLDDNCRDRTAAFGLQLYRQKPGLATTRARPCIPGTQKN
jgi:hypothetical protein